MSGEAFAWALNMAPVPLDSSGKPNPACAFVLSGLAWHAGPDGGGAFVSVPTLIRYTRLSGRTVRTALSRLEALGVIRPREPQGWDLNMALVRDDLANGVPQ